MAGDVFCNKCGHANPLGSNFCSSCGSPLESARTEAPTVTFTADELDIDEARGNEAVGDVPAGLGALVVTRGRNAGSRFVLHEEVTRAGRHPDSHIFLDDVTVSRRHSEIERVDDGYVVRDAGSLNGTYLNRERVDEAPIGDGDELQIGSFKLVFVRGEA